MRTRIPTNGGDYNLAWIDRELERLDRSLRRIGFALWAMYGLSCGASSFGLAHFWGWAAQLIALPVYFVGGVLSAARVTR